MVDCVCMVCLVAGQAGGFLLQHRIRVDSLALNRCRTTHIQVEWEYHDISLQSLDTLYHQVSIPRTSYFTSLLISKEYIEDLLSCIWLLCFPRIWDPDWNPCWVSWSQKIRINAWMLWTPFKAPDWVRVEIVDIYRCKVGRDWLSSSATIKYFNRLPRIPKLDCGPLPCMIWRL